MSSVAPTLPAGQLDALWLQVGGTLCNLACTHCFISCSPSNRSLELMTLGEIEPIAAEAERLGVKEFYLTGGEVFIVDDLERIVERLLAVGPVTVLTNGTLVTEERAARFAEIARASRYTLEFRVSVDGFRAEDNDVIRGAGSFEKAMRGVERLTAAGFLPIITATQVWEPARDREVMEGFIAELRRRGCSRPRFKILPRLKIGAEAERTEGYAPEERITVEMMQDYDPARLLCHSSRMVSARGVHICPILVDDPRGFLGMDLAASMRPYKLAAQACYTCWQYGAICSNVSSGEAGDATGY